jgi:hypothetical protein
MSLFIATLAFGGTNFIDSAKVGILGGSINAALNQFVAETLMVPFPMVMHHVRGERPTKVLLTDTNDRPFDATEYRRHERPEARVTEAAYSLLPGVQRRPSPADSSNRLRLSPQTRMLRSSSPASAF